jgi:alanine racemase
VRGLATLTIDLDAVVANYRLVESRLAPGCRIAAVVKADAYGLGADEVAARLHTAGCRHFFVATGEEGRRLRAVFEDAEPVDQPQIYVLDGPTAGDAADLMSAWLTPVLNTTAQLGWWRDLARDLDRPLPAAVHVDSGMNRLGFLPDELAALLNQPRLWTGVDVQLVISHLACADEPGHPKNDLQRRVFERSRRRFPAARACFANSAGVLLGHSFHHELVRPGIALYGGNPFKSGANEFRPVVEVSAAIVQVHEIDSPQTVGYGATHSVAGPSRIATVPVGYADGYPRSLSNVGFGYLGGIRVPLVGRVSMDLTTFDVTSVPPALAQPGANLELIGTNARLDDVANAAGTIAYEILTRLGSRYERRYLGSVL